jgi:ankyrin repeat protein
MVASNKGFIELVNDILSRDAWVNHADGEGKSALHYAIESKAENLDVVKLLMDKDADFNKETTSEGWSPLIIAVNRGHKAIAKALVDVGANIEAAEWSAQNTALHIACLKGEKEIVELLATDATYERLCLKTNKQG